MVSDIWKRIEASLRRCAVGPRAVGRSENPGVPVSLGEHNLLPLVEIGLTHLPKSGGAMAPLEPPGTTGLGPLELNSSSHKTLPNDEGLLPGQHKSEYFLFPFIIYLLKQYFEHLFS